MTKKRKKNITEIAEGVPSNFQFGLIVGTAIFWTEFIQDVISYFTSKPLNGETTMLVSFITALIFTVLTFLILRFYVQIREKLKKIKF
jgi:hypothetical protein